MSFIFSDNRELVTANYGEAANFSAFDVQWRSTEMLAPNMQVHMNELTCQAFASHVGMPF